MHRRAPSFIEEGDLIVCSCNTLSDRAIRGVVETGGDAVGRISDVFAHLGCRAQCGRCVPTIRRLVRECSNDECVSCPAVLGEVETANAATALMAAE